MQEFHCERSDESGLTLTSLAMLLSECPRLTVVRDIQAWQGIEPAEVRFIPIYPTKRIMKNGFRSAGSNSTAMRKTTI